MASESIERFLKAERREISVPRDSEITLGPDNGESGKDVHRLEVRSFEDLQALRLIAPELNEKAVREAMAADDEDAWQTARRIVESGKAPCGCKGHDAEPGTDRQEHAKPRNPAADLQSTYRALRRGNHPNLARAISSELNSRIEADSPAAKGTYGWVSGIEKAKVITGLGALHYADVIINHNATLALASAVNVFFCGNLRIHLGGRLRIKSSYIKVNCLSVQGNLA